MLFLNKHNKHILLKLMLFLNKHNKHTFETYVLSGLFVLIKCGYVCVGRVATRTGKTGMYLNVLEKKWYWKMYWKSIPFQKCT